MEEAQLALAARLEAADVVLAREGDEHDELDAVVKQARRERDTAVERSAALGAESGARARGRNARPGRRRLRASAASVGRPVPATGQELDFQVVDPWYRTPSGR
jgi:hypothetical protein